MRSPSGSAAVVVLALLLITCGSPQGTEQAGAGTTTRGSGGGSYDDLAGLFEEFRELAAPGLVDSVPDYSPATMAGIYEELRAQQRRLAETTW
jgi:hypothetical protein